MEFLKTLLDAIPKQHHVWVALAILIVYYGFPRFQEWRSKNRHFDSVMRVLAFKKMLLEVEVLRKQASVNEVADPDLKFLEATVADLWRDKFVVPAARRFVAGLFGALAAFALLALVYLTGGHANEVGQFVIGALILSIIAGIPTLLYRSDKLYKSALFGGGAGLLIAFVIGVLTS